MYQYIYLAITSLLLAACGGGSSSGSASSGQLSLSVTDGPVESAEHVVISFTGIELKPEQGNAFAITLDSPMTLDLLSYQNGERATLLDGETLSAGRYQWIRLAVNESNSYIEIAGQQHPLTIPSAAQRGLQMNRPFTIGAGTLTDFTVDFDLRKSVHQQGQGDYKLRPTLRLIDTLQTATITGTVDESLIIDASCNNGSNNDSGNAVYLFEGLDSTPQDIYIFTDPQDSENSIEQGPLVTASVSFNSDSGLYEFSLAYVPLGDYRIAFTCDSSLDQPDQDNSANQAEHAIVSFSADAPLSVTADTAPVQLP